MLKEIILSWQFLAVFATLLWSIINIVDKHIISEKIRQVRIAIIFTFVGSLIILAILQFFAKIVLPAFPILALIVFSGILWIVAVIFYYKALQQDEVSRIIPIFLLDPIFTAILAAVFLREVFSPTIYFGLLLVVGGAILISIKKREGILFGKGFWFILASTIIISADGIILKFVLEQLDFVSVFFWGRVGAAIGAIPFFLLYKKNFFDTIKLEKTASTILFSTDLLSAIAGIIITLAIALGPVTLITTITATQSLFVFAFALIISKLNPRILREDTGKTTIAVKLLAIIMMIFGSYLVAT